MCVITLVEAVRPTDEQVRQMFEQNPKGGGGIAWREVINPEEAEKFRVTPGVPVVRWRKGLNKEQMVSANKELPFPYVLHFRQPSHDTSQSMLACHPFQIDPEATTGFEGTFEGYVLFHNGSWGGWRQKLENLCIASGGRIKVPSGAWSDTRALAFCAHHFGLYFLEAANEKVIAFGPGELDIEQFGGPWLDVPVPGQQGNIVCSNRSWERTYTVTDRRNDTSKLLNAAQAAVTPTVRNEGTGGSPLGTFRHPYGCAAGAAGQQSDQQESVQKAAQGTVTRDGTGPTYTPVRAGTLEQRVCTGCGKSTPVGTRILEQWFCLQCWADSTGLQAKSPIRWTGICRRCKVGSSGMKEVLNDEWICHACWDTNGRPRTYYAKDLATEGE